MDNYDEFIDRAHKDIVKDARENGIDGSVLIPNDVQVIAVKGENAVYSAITAKPNTQWINCVSLKLFEDEVFLGHILVEGEVLTPPHWTVPDDDSGWLLRILRLVKRSPLHPPHP